MKQRFSTHTTLIELTLALLFLMLTSITILSLFMAAYEKSVEADLLTRAVQTAQDYAAQISAGDSLEQTLYEMGFDERENGLLGRETVHGLHVLAACSEEQTGVGIMARCSLTVTDGELVLAQWPISRYYNKEVIHP